MFRAKARKKTEASLELAIKLLEETTEKVDQAALSLLNANGALSILQAEVSELKNFCKELILYEHDHRKELMKLENMSRKYDKMLAHLEIEIPALLSQISLWNEVYSRDKKAQTPTPVSPDHTIQAMNRLPEMEKRGAVTS